MSVEGKLTAAQRRMLEAAGKLDRFGEGVILYDGHQDRVAKALSDKGLVFLPPGFGFVYGSRHGVRLTDAGRAALALTEQKQ